MTKLQQTVETLLKYKKFKEIKVINRVGGLSNENYLVDIDGSKKIIRVPGEAMHELETCTLLSESLNASKFAKAASCFIPIKIVNGIKIQDYIEGARTLENEDVAKNIKQVAKVLVTMHNETEKLVTHFNLNAILNKYTTACFVRNATNNNLRLCVDLARKIDSFLKSRKTPKVASHNDPLANNWVFDKTGKLHLIDYEYAGQNYYAFDLAAVITECKLDRHDANDLIIRYLAESKEVDLSFNQIQIDVDACIFYQEVIWALWGYVKAYDINGNLIDSEMLDYADARLTVAYQRLNYTTDLLES